jgi:glycopeptide antibiotics resistance protein
VDAVGWLRDRRVAVPLAAVYLVALVVLVAGPWGWWLNRLTVRLYVLFRYDWPVVPDVVGPEHYGALLNVLLFVPLGLLVVVVTRWSWWWVTLAAAVVSTAIEVVQWLFLARVGEVGDVVANTLGALAGAVAGATAINTRARRRSRRAGR